MITTFKNLMHAWVTGLHSHCHHRRYNESVVILYCMTLSTAYVAALYVLVPSKIRKLDRDHPKHIQFRSLASFVVCAGVIGTYPLLFCSLGNDDDDKQSRTFSIVEVISRPRDVQGVLLHTMSLYLGPIAAGLIRVYEFRKRALASGNQNKKPGSFVQETFGQLLKPTLLSIVNPCTEEERWRNIRNFLVAPVTEEIVFRGAMVPALLASGMSPLRVALVAPLFFGIAHVHHAMTRLSKGERFTPVLFMTFFQFSYTYMFGSYAAYAFIRTGSVAAVTLSHTYCNWMGLPDLSFTQPRHPMYEYRKVLLASFLIGAFTFKWFLSADILLPLPPVLVQMIGDTR